jgi:cell division transport system permease protein
VRPGFFLKEAWRSIRGNLGISVAATVTVLIAVFILGAFIPSFLYVQSAVDAQKAKVDINAYLRDDVSSAQLNGLQGKLKANPDIASFTYVSKQDALEVMRKRLKDPTILEELPSNPFPASFNIRPTDPERADAIIASIRRDAALDPEDGIAYGKATADRLLEVARFIQWAGLGLIAVLVVAAVLLIGNTIRLSIFARRREVEVMKLVGATNWFIRWPFMIEGVICGLVGALLSIGLLFAVKVGVVDEWVSSADSALTRDDATTIGFVWLAAILVAAGALLGALGSGLTLRRFLKV